MMGPSPPKTHVRLCRRKPAPCSCPKPISIEYSTSRILLKRIKPRFSPRRYLRRRYKGLAAKVHTNKDANTEPTMLTRSLRLFSEQFRLLTSVPADLLPLLGNAEVAHRDPETRDGPSKHSDSDSTANLKSLKRNLIIHDIPNTVTPGHLLAMFGRYGAIVAANIAIDPDTDYYEICTSAYITFLRESSATRVWNVYQERGFLIFKKKCQMVEPVDDEWAFLRPSMPGVGYFQYDWEEEGFVACEAPETTEVK